MIYFEVLEWSVINIMIKLREMQQLNVPYIYVLAFFGCFFFFFFLSSLSFPLKSARVGALLT